VAAPQPDDLVAVAHQCVDELRSLVDRDWSAPAGELDWTCCDTLEHLCLLAYGPVLAIRAVEFRPLALTTTANAPVEQLLRTAEANALMLAAIARGTPPDVRAFHPVGMADASGFVAMGMDEFAVHTYDIATGLDAEFALDEAATRIVLDRLFPWWPRDAEPWRALLWANGRIALPDRARQGPEWSWHCAPIAEWNGRIPRWDPVRNVPAEPL
jgi:hypothetical protein